MHEEVVFEKNRHASSILMRENQGDIGTDSDGLWDLRDGMDTEI